MVNALLQKENSISCVECVLYGEVINCSAELGYLVEMIFIGHRNQIHMHGSENKCIEMVSYAIIALFGTTKSFDVLRCQTYTPLRYLTKVVADYDYARKRQKRR